MNELIK